MHSIWWSCLQEDSAQIICFYERGPQIQEEACLQGLFFLTSLDAFLDYIVPSNPSQDPGWPGGIKPSKNRRDHSVGKAREASHACISWVEPWCSLLAARACRKGPWIHCYGSKDMPTKDPQKDWNGPPR